jgi:hypothetical protein
MPDSAPEGYPFKLRRLYWPFLALAEVCQDVVGTVAGSFEREGKRYTIPRFVFLGPSAGRAPIRLGLFALLRGNELAGARGLQRLLDLLAAEPVLASGYELAIYPVCNPTGFEDGTPHNRAGRNLRDEFWRGSAEPEVRILETEIRRRRFHGMISLQSADVTGDALPPPPGQEPGPLRVVCEIPAAGSMTQQVEAISCALQAFLKECRDLVTPEFSL